MHKTVSRLKTSLFKYSLLTGFLGFAIACSTKKDTFLARNSHALSTKYNILYNGGLALDAGLVELKTTYADNYWDVLPIERMQPKEEGLGPEDQRNPNFERAETKATKAIQKHSMNIGGAEKNPQMDEAHLMLGQARYYEQRFIPALEAFNYVLYKYPASDKINEVKIWREKTNMRLENDQIAVNNLRKLLGEIKLKDQIYADANATLAQAFLNLNQQDSALARLRTATLYTKSNEEKARYRFIGGQLFEKAGQKDSAYAAYQSVIDMNRKSPRIYVLQAHARQAAQFDPAKGDTLLFVEKFNKMLEDRENRPYLDILNHEMALYYEKKKDQKEALKYYNRSLRKNSQDQYLVASNYRNMAEIYFDQAKYTSAGQYYDSTLVNLKERTREFNLIRKKRENLVDVIKYEGIARENDSILKLVAMSEDSRKKFFEDYTAKLKEKDEKEKLAAEKAAEAGKNNPGSDDGAIANEDVKRGAMKGTGTKTSTSAGSSAGKASDFYFYNPTTLAFGKNEFRKVWGNRAHGPNWRTSVNDKKTDENQGGIADAKKDPTGGVSNEVRYSPEFYIGQIPTDQKVIDSLAKERNFAYYQLGVIYKEKFREYALATDKLEKLLQNQPEERLILPSMYNLYKIYEITNSAKATEMRDRILSMYPDSRYAQILSNADSESGGALSPEIAYNQLFEVYESGDYKKVLADSGEAIDQFTGDEIVPKMELLRAHTIGKLRGIAEYKKALNFVALSYPNSIEGKQAEALLAREIPAIEKLKFSKSPTENWKILYRANDLTAKSTKYLHDKLKKFLADRDPSPLKMSYDLYTETENFLVVRGIKSEEAAKSVATILKDFKDYRIPDEAIIISGQNYEVVQMKKNLAEYLANPEMVEQSVTEQLPFTPPPKEVAKPKAQTPDKTAKQQQTKANAQQPQVPGKNQAQQGKGNTQQNAMPNSGFNQPSFGNQPTFNNPAFNQNNQNPTSSPNMPPGTTGGPPPTPKR